jgi:hypothetical protein
MKSNDICCSFDSVYSEKIGLTFFKSFTVPSMRLSSRKCISSIFFNFFFRQYHSVLLKGRIPVSNVDHPLDKKIPFVKSWVTIYVNFVSFWVKMLSFFLRRYGKRAYKLSCDFIESIGRLYAFAAVVYKKNLSTTKRPFYIGSPRFFLIHLADPHLMCIPSLHVMVVVHTYTMFNLIVRQLGEEEKYRNQIIEMKQGALAIAHAVLFIKQHSVNCIPAALYGMNCFCPSLFTRQEAEEFIQQLFSPAPKPAYKTSRRVHPMHAPVTKLPQEDIEEIKAHILALYRRFFEEGKTAKTWDEPLVKFLREIG